tara:strand:+ start:965 stop:1411 length:447 start_codon:yes stop_codon:yes gene_type:complete
MLKAITKLKFSFFSLMFSIFLTSFIVESSVPAPQSLVVTLTGYRNQDNALKCKLYYMITLPKDPSVIKNIHLTLEKISEKNETERVSEITVPFDWAEAQKVEGVVSFYTTRNLLYIGIGEYDFLSRYQCKAAFINANGEKSQYVVYKK